MSDHIELRAMRFEGRHGVLPVEAVAPQPFEVDIVLEEYVDRSINWSEVRA